jgi:hypothetical protein
LIGSNAPDWCICYLLQLSDWRRQLIRGRRMR